MKSIWGLCVVFSGLLLCTPASAITVEIVKGEVSVKQGEGFRKITAPTEVYRGDKVMAAPDSRAKIVYPTGCVVPVYPGGIATVGECKEPMTAGLEEPVVEAAPYGSWVPYALGAVVVGVGACAIAGCFDSDDNGRRRRVDEEDSP